jgi:hypothetical protein
VYHWCAEGCDTADLQDAKSLRDELAEVPESAATHLNTAYGWFKPLQVPKWVEKTEQRAHACGVTLTDATLPRLRDGKSHIC